MFRPDRTYLKPFVCAAEWRDIGYARKQRREPCKRRCLHDETTKIIKIAK